ncbi:hypothetical protein ACFX15_005983 [Malus domestica]
MKEIGNDNLVEAEKTKGKNTNGKCNGNRKASRNTEPFPDLGFGDVETNYEDSDGFRSGSSSSSEGEQPVKRKRRKKMPKFIPFRSDLDMKNWNDICQ